MDKQYSTRQQIVDAGLLPLFYHDDPDVCLSVIKALYDAGIRIIEFTNRGKHSVENFKIMRTASDQMPGLVLGVGTIKNADDAARFIEAGADLLISPVFDDVVCDIADRYDILWIPGCMTPTEIQHAKNAGCTLIKLFPGNVLGTAFIPAIRPLFPDLQFLVTGGVETSQQNISEWFANGADCIGIGSNLITEEYLTKKNFPAITTESIKVMEHIRSIRKKSPQ
jgi:2-dehydro-3-deoxyphosphogluconate aldolase/(4S)-4-hydroxy-2-oxoglutarate aldolase